MNRSFASLKMKAESRLQEKSQLLGSRQRFRGPILSLGRLNRYDFRLNLNRQIVVANRDIVQPVSLVFTRPTFCVHLAHVGDRVTQALYSPVDVNDFVEVTLRPRLVRLVLISVPVVAADFGCELNLQAQRVQMPGRKQHVVESLGMEVGLASIEH